MRKGLKPEQDRVNQDAAGGRESRQDLSVSLPNAVSPYRHDASRTIGSILFGA